MPSRHRGVTHPTTGDLSLYKGRGLFPATVLRRHDVTSIKVTAFADMHAPHAVTLRHNMP